MNPPPVIKGSFHLFPYFCSTEFPTPSYKNISCFLGKCHTVSELTLERAYICDKFTVFLKVDTDIFQDLLSRTNFDENCPGILLEKKFMKCMSGCFWKSRRVLCMLILMEVLSLLLCIFVPWRFPLITVFNIRRSKYESQKSLFLYEILYQIL